MTTPPLLLGAALLFWGWHTGFFLGAAVIALILDGSRLVAWRCELSRQDVNRIQKLCGLVLAVMLVFLLATLETVHGLLVLLSLYPMTIVPLIVAHAYDVAGTVDAGMLLFLSWGDSSSVGGRPHAPLDPSYPYLAILLFAASAANVRGAWFYPGFFLLSAWALWGVRPRRYSTLVWAGLLASAGAMGYAGQLGLVALQQKVEARLLPWFIERTSGGGADPSASYTAIGHVGQLKLSDTIALRVDSAGIPVPFLLHAASYNRYASSIWMATDAGFHSVPPASEGWTWTFRTDAAPARSLTVHASLAGGKGVLPLPTGTSQIDHLPVGSLQRNRFGAVKAADGPGFVSYQAHFDPRAGLGTPPDAADLSVPREEAPLISRIALELGLPSQSPPQVLRTVSQYFQQHFRYSLFQTDQPVGSSPLENFLLRTRSGHCEYFATATVLLLRQAGIPARYATGYSVQEFSRLEHRYVVRNRDAHAWALAYVDGDWQVLDTTPAVWVEAEQENASWLQPLSDLWSWAKFQVSSRQWSFLRADGGLSLAWLLVPMGLFLAWRFYAAKRIVRPGKSRRQSTDAPAWSGADSEFYVLAERLEQLQCGRHPWEPLGHWVDRMKTTRGLPVEAESLRGVVSLHNRYRFDPQGIGLMERERLRSQVRSLLEQIETRHARV